MALKKYHRVRTLQLVHSQSTLLHRSPSRPRPLHYHFLSLRVSHRVRRHQAQSQMLTTLSLSLPHASQHPTRLLLSRLPTLRFWSLMPKGGGEYVRHRGILWEGFGLLSATSCISCLPLCTYLCTLWYTLDGAFVMVIVTCVLSFIFIYHVMCAIAHMLCFRVLLRFIWALLLVLVLISYSWVLVIAWFV